MRRLTHELTYDAPLARVSAMLADPAFREEVCARQQVLSARVAVEESAGVRTVVVDQTQSTAGIASFARGVVGDEITIVQRETWADQDRASVEVDLPGKPGEISGQVVLTESGGVTIETVDLEVKVRIPLVGGKMEGLIVDLLGKALRVENSVGRDYLAR